MNRVLWIAGLLGVAVLLFSLATQPTQAQVVGSLHDLSATGPNSVTTATRVCVFCHTPHQATAAAGQYPLWNHTINSPAPTYGTYTSITMEHTATEIGGAFVLGSASASLLCMSCHDGTISVASMYNPPNEGVPAVTGGGNVLATGLMTGTPNVGTDLTDDHPVNFTYDDTLDAEGELDTVANVDAAGLLIGGTVQCASCHDVHDPTNTPFLTMDNTNSALCTTCHLK